MQISQNSHHDPEAMVPAGVTLRTTDTRNYVTLTTSSNEPSQMSNMDLLESRRIEYESLKIIKCISSGSDGAIWEVEWNGGRFAMKQIHKARDKKYDEEKVAMMLKLKHPNIIELLKLCVEPYCFIMEMCKCNLHEIIKDNESISSKDFEKYASQLANGMKYLHSQNVAHRDLKSENVLITTDLVVKICDFDRSKSFSMDAVLMSTQAGSPLWMAPEMLNGQQKFTATVDAWSYAVILWEMITQRLPYDSLLNEIVRSPSDLEKFSSNLSNSKIRLQFPVGTPQLLRILLSECLVSQPDKRPGFEKIAKCIENLKVEEKSWTALKPKWREMPLVYTYSQQEEDDFIRGRETFAAMGKRFEEIITNLTNLETLENKIWNFEAIKEVISIRENIDLERFYTLSLVPEEPNLNHFSHVIESNTFLLSIYDDYTRKIKPKRIGDDEIKYAIYCLGCPNLQMQILASKDLFHVISTNLRPPEDIADVIISSVKPEYDVELVMNCLILLTLPSMRPFFIGKSSHFLINALRIHINEANMTHLFLFLLYSCYTGKELLIRQQIAETSIAETVTKALASSKNDRLPVVRNWWKILYLVTDFDSRASSIFSKNGGLPCFYAHVDRYRNDPSVLLYIFDAVASIIHFSSRAQFLTKEFIEEHLLYIRLTREHAFLCRPAVYNLILLLNEDESAWKNVNITKSSCSEMLTKAIMAWSLAKNWNLKVDMKVSKDDNDCRLLYKISSLAKSLLFFSSEYRFEILQSLQAMINDSRTSDDVRLYTEVVHLSLQLDNM